MFQHYSTRYQVVFFLGIPLLSENLIQQEFEDFECLGYLVVHLELRSGRRS